MQTPTLTTTNHIIRPFQEQDLEIFTRYRADKNIAQYQGWSDYTYEKALEFFANMDYSTFAKINTWYQFAITTKNTDTIQGDMAIHFTSDNSIIEIGYTIAPENQGKGMAFECVSALIDYAFKELNINQILAYTDVKNQPSYKLLEKLNFTQDKSHPKNINADYEEYKYILNKTL